MILPWKMGSGVPDTVVLDVMFQFAGHHRAGTCLPDYCLLGYIVPDISSNRPVDLMRHGQLRRSIVPRDC